MRRTFLLFALAAALLLEWLPSSANRYDEGLVLTGAMRILGGELPYRDFWTVYGPGETFQLAALFKLLPPSLMAARVLDVMWRMLALVAARRLVLVVSGSRAWADYSLLVLAIWLGNFTNFNYPAIPALALSLLSLATLLSGRAFTGGALAGATPLFRHDFGTYLVATSTISTALHQLRARRPRLALAYFSGLALVAAPPALWLLRHIPADALYQPLVRYPSQVQEVFLAAHRHRDRFRGGSLVSTWLYSITSRLVAKARRRARWRGWLSGSAAEAAAELLQRRASPVELLEQRQAQARVYQILDRLSERQRTVLALFEIEGHSGEEIAALTHQRVETVWVQLHRARAAFLRELQRLEGKP